MKTLSDFQLDYNSGVPVWTQVRNRVAFLIATNRLSAGERLPTVRALAVDLDISYNTVNRAYMDLERDGFIHTRKGRGTFVAEAKVGELLLIDNNAAFMADAMIQEATNLGMIEEDIIKLVEERLAHRAASVQKTVPQESQEQSRRSAV